MSVDLLLTPSGARGSVVTISRDERSRRTALLLARAAAALDNKERRRLLDEVVLLNCRVADSVAARYRGRGVPFEDLVQVAYEGLVKAVHSFDTSRGHDLLTFAVPTIRGEVQRYFRDRAWMVRPPRRVQELQWRIPAVIDRFHADHGREPDEREVCALLAVAEHEYAEMITAFGCFRPLSLDRPGDTESPGSPGAVLGDLVADEDVDLAAAEARCVLEPALRDLDARDRELLRLRFVEERTQNEIGAVLGLTQTQVSRRLDRIVRDLRRRLVEPARLSA